MLKKILELCKKRDISVTALEVELGFGRCTISKWKNSSPSVDNLKKVADYFEVSVDYLLSSDTASDLQKWKEEKKLVEPYKHLYTIKEAAEVLKVNKNQIYEFINSGRLDALKLGSKKIRGADLEKFINQYPVEKISD